MWEDFKKYMSKKHNIEIETKQGFYHVVVVYKGKEIKLFSPTLVDLEKEFFNIYVD